jgi:terminase, large subunit
MTEHLACARDTVRRQFVALKPPPRLKLSEWADEYFYLSAESAAEPGRWKTYAYQREPMDALTDPRVVQVTWMKSARLGFTKTLNAAIAYYMAHDPCSILLIQPSEDDAEGYSKEEIGPMLRDCPVLQELIPESLQRKNSMQHIRYRGGVLQLAGARSPGNFRRVSRRVVFGDEVDGYPPSAGKEGDPIELAKKRAEYFWNRKYAWGSTPTNAGSRIEQLFHQGDQRRYYVPCPHCGHMDFLVFWRETTANDGKPAGHFLDWPKGRPEEAHFVCSDCGCAIEHADKRTMLDAGEWRAHAPFDGHASFHIWTAYSASPNATWADIAREYEKAEAAGPDQLKTFVNTWLGEVWKGSGDAPEWELLYQRRETYAQGSCPAGVLLLTCGVDVQKDRLVYEVVGWGRGKQSWSIDAGVLTGDTADLAEKGPWPQLDALLARTFPHAHGTELRIARLAVDSGFNTQTVYTWARRKPLSQVIAVKGVDSVGVLIGTPSKVDVTVSGRRVGYKVWKVSGHVAKTELYGWLRLGPPTDEARDAGATEPPGFCHFPQYGEDYFKQLTAEQLVPHKTPQGFTSFVWELIPGRENHFLDCRTYARAAAAVEGLDRWRESDWTRLEHAVGQPPPALPTPGAPVPTRPTPSSAPPRSGTARPGWIQRRPGYLQKGR